MHFLKNASVKLKKNTKKSGDFFNQSMVLTGLLVLAVSIALLFRQPPWLCKCLQTLTQLVQVISEYLSGKLYTHMVIIFGEEPVKISAEWITLAKGYMIEMTTLAVNESIRFTMEMLESMGISVKHMQHSTPEEVEAVTKGPFLVVMLIWWWRRSVMGRLLARLLKRLLALIRLFFNVLKITTRML